MSNPFEACISEGQVENASSLAHCLAASASSQATAQRNLDASIIVSDPLTVVPFVAYSASLVFFMQAGFAMICAGSVRKKNVQNTILKNLLDLCGAAVAFYSVGYAFAFGDSDPNDNDARGFIGSGNFFLLGMTTDETGIDYMHWVFQFAFAATSATIVAGTLAERCQMNAYLLYSMTLTGFVYPVVVHAVWSDNGFLSNRINDPLLGCGMLDFAGSGVVHVTGGFTALIATKMLGARKGRFIDERGEPREEPLNFPGHSKSLQMLGTLVLWFGWLGFNGGSAISKDGTFHPAVVAVSLVNTVIAGATSGVSALFLNLFITERLTGEPHYNLSIAMNGCLSGLAAITGSCGVIEPWSAAVIGLIAGVLFLGTSMLLLRLHLDDAVDAIPVHLTGGVWGVISTGLFASPTGLRRYFDIDTANHVGLFFSFGRGEPDGTLLGCQIIGLIFIISWVAVIMLPFFVVLNYMGMLRADSLEEIVGLDVSYHGWTPANVDDVSQSDLNNISRNSKWRNLSRHGDQIQADEHSDNGGVDVFE